MSYFKSLTKGVALLAVLLASATASAAFVGAYDVANWSQSANTGSINLAGAPNTVSLTSSNAGGGAHNTDFTIVAVASGLVTFDWSYVNGDVDGSGFDPFGWLLNGAFNQLTGNGQFGGQSGSVSFFANAGDVFGFRANSVDSAFGSSTGTISNFEAVPEPESLALLGVALAGLSLARRRRA